MEKLYQWWDKKSGLSQVMTLAAFLYAVSTPVAVIAGILAM